MGDLLPPSSWHRAWWAAKSSQTLALIFLAAAVRADPTLDWLPKAETLGDHRVGLFEVELAEHVLNERPRQTQLDFLAIGAAGVIAVEAKFTERGFGSCSCSGRDTGVCSARIYDRPYWSVAKDELGLLPVDGSCPLSVAYQPVRNLAAAQAIGKPERASAFVLLYDRRNPYFLGVGEWPGWTSLLDRLTRYGRTPFEAVSWQQFLARAPLDPSFITWAAEKHGIEPQEHE